MNSDQYFPYVLAVRWSSRLKNGTLQEFFDSDDHYPIYFDSDGYYYEKSGKISGAYRFCETSELDDVAQKFAWPIISDCPFFMNFH